MMRKTRRRTRGFTDRLYLANFVAVQIVVISIIILTALSGKLGITDMSALASVPAFAYAELGIHSGFICWKNKAENIKRLNLQMEDII